MFPSPFRSPFGRTTKREKFGSSVSVTEISNQSKVIKIGRGYKESLVTTSTTFTNIKIPVYPMEVTVTVYQNILGMKHSRAPPSNVVTLFKVEGVGEKHGVSDATQSKVSVVPELELVRLSYGKYFTIVDLNTIGYGYRLIAFDTIVVHMSVMERKVSLEVKPLPLVGNTVRLKAEFTEFNGELVDVFDATLTVYEGKNKVLTEVTPERLSEGVYFYDYIVPEFSGGSLYFEFKGMLNDKPILGRTALGRSWIDVEY